MERIHNQISLTTCNTNYSKAPILDITQASTPDLRTLLKLFKANISGTATEKDMLDELLKFIPIAHVQSPLARKGSANICTNCSCIGCCSWCQRECCEHHPLRSCSYPRTGSVSSKLCIAHNQHEDAKDWAQASINFLAQTNDESIIASLGCLLVAIALGFDSQKLLKSIARILHSHGLNSVAYRIIHLVISQDNDKNEPKVYFLVSSILHDLVKKERMILKEKSP